MKKSWSLHSLILIMAVAIAFILTLYSHTQAQLPTSYYYSSPLSFPEYGYFNTIDGYLLGYNTFNPFLAPPVADAYTLAGIPIYGYLTNPYATAFPYATLDVLAPYAPPVYPTFTYGAPDLYVLWLNLNL
ncbi:MAG: hypothetical protein ACMUJM_03300 [bacterium]